MNSSCMVPETTSSPRCTARSLCIASVLKHQTHPEPGHPDKKRRRPCPPGVAHPARPASPKQTMARKLQWPWELTGSAKLGVRAGCGKAWQTCPRSPQASWHREVAAMAPSPIRLLPRPPPQEAASRTGSPPGAD